MAAKKKETSIVRSYRIFSMNAENAFIKAVEKQFNARIQSEMHLRDKMLEEIDIFFDKLDSQQNVALIKALDNLYKEDVDESDKIVAIKTEKPMDVDQHILSGKKRTITEFEAGNEDDDDDNDNDNDDDYGMPQKKKAKHGYCVDCETSFVSKRIFLKHKGCATIYHTEWETDEC